MQQLVAQAQLLVWDFLPFTTAVLSGNNSLAAQLKMVARLIAARSSLGAKRQVFFVSAGGLRFARQFNMQVKLKNERI